MQEITINVSLESAKELLGALGVLVELKVAKDDQGYPTETWSIVCGGAITVDTTSTTRFPEGKYRVLGIHFYADNDSRACTVKLVKAIPCDACGVTATLKIPVGLGNSLNLCNNCIPVVHNHFREE